MLMCMVNRQLASRNVRLGSFLLGERLFLMESKKSLFVDKRGRL